MKKSFALGVLMVGATMAYGYTARTIDEPVLTESSFTDGYVPDGFDTNDNVQIVGEGWYKNGCHKPGLTQVQVDHNNKKIRVQPHAYVYSGFCPQMVVNFDEVLNVGFLQAGKYEVLQGDSNEKLGEVNVRVATNSTPDDFFYAPIEQAYVNAVRGKATVKLSGVFSNSCMRLANVMTTVQPKVLVVQPIAELADRNDCQEGKFAFEKDVEVRGMPTGRYLLHVRSLNSKAVNTLFDVE